MHNLPQRSVAQQLGIKQILRLRHLLRSRPRSHPTRHWHILLCFHTPDHDHPNQNPANNSPLSQTHSHRILWLYFTQLPREVGISPSQYPTTTSSKTSPGPVPETPPATGPACS